MGKLNDELRKLVPDIKECILLQLDEYKEYFKDSILVWAKPWEFKDSVNIEFQKGEWRVYLRSDIYLCKEPKDTALCGLLEPVCNITPAPTYSEIVTGFNACNYEVIGHLHEGLVTVEYREIGMNKIYVAFGKTPEDAAMQVWLNGRRTALK